MFFSGFLCELKQIVYESGMRTSLCRGKSLRFRTSLNPKTIAQLHFANKIKATRGYVRAGMGCVPYIQP